MRGWQLRTKALSITQQWLGLRRDFPDGTGELTRGRLTWTTALHPTPLSRDYLVRLDYREGDTPRVFVVEPSLSQIAGVRRIPHLYQQDPACLCLYRSIYGEWSPDKAISRTIIPWAASWLFYFEDWLLSDEWRGGGEHPTPLRNPKRRRERRWSPMRLPERRSCFS